MQVIEQGNQSLPSSPVAQPTSSKPQEDSGAITRSYFAASETEVPYFATHQFCNLLQFPNFSYHEVTRYLLVSLYFCPTIGISLLWGLNGSHFRLKNAAMVRKSNIRV